MHFIIVNKSAIPVYFVHININENNKIERLDKEIVNLLLFSDINNKQHSVVKACNALYIFFQKLYFMWGSILSAIVTITRGSRLGCYHLADEMSLEEYNGEV